MKTLAKWGLFFALAIVAAIWLPSIIECSEIRAQIAKQIRIDNTIEWQYTSRMGGCEAGIFEIDEAAIEEIKKHRFEAQHIDWQKTPIAKEELSEGHIRGDFCFSSKFNKQIYKSALSKGGYYTENYFIGGMHTLLVLPDLKWVVYFRAR